MRTNFYAGVGIDRASERRRDESFIAEKLSSPRARVIAVWRNQNLVAGEMTAALFLSVPAITPVAAPRIYLGSDAEANYFMADLSHLDEPALAPIVGAGKFVDLRDVGAGLAHQEGGLLAYARGLAYWHARHRFCGVCGSPTEMIAAGHVRRCANPDCAAEHFPRTDPAVIMLVTDGDRCLLAWSHRWQTPMYSTLAGFVEPGESLEDAVIREVKEEAGIDVTDVRYHSSQPWPFPASIMLGFTARALTTTVTVDPEEIREARWFTREQLKGPHDPDQFRLPRGVSIARRLIEDWIAG